MDIENIETHGQAGIEFTDRTGTPCILWILENIKDLRFDLDTDFSQFSQEDIKALLPYLEAYVNSGTLELHTFLPLQKLMMDWADLIANYTPYASSWGKDVWDEWHERLNKETEQALAGLSNTDDYVAQIKALQQIVKRWVEPQDTPSQGESFSSIAQSIMGIIITNTMPPKTSYIAAWSICDILGVDRGQLNCAIPGTEYDKALKELIDAGVAEELPDLGCRYRLTKKYRERSSSQGDKERIAMAAVIEDPAKRIEALVETTARMNVRNYRYEQLLKEWKKYGQPSSDSKSPDELIHMTDQLMEESARSVEGVNDLEKANKAKAYYMRQCDKQVDHIANLEELLEEWSKFASEATMIHPPYMIHQIELQKKTTQLLGDDNDR